MTWQSKPLLRFESLEDRRRLGDALAILAARRRDGILEAVAMSARELLRSGDLTQSLPKVIERIGRATGVDRAHILAIDPTAPDRGHIVQHYLWQANEIAMPPLVRDARGSAMTDVGLASFLDKLAAGEVVVGHVRSLEKVARRFFTSLGVKSVMAVPVFVEGRWWGHIGFDDCRVEREWSPAEIDTLKTLAELIGATVSARRHEAILEAVALSAKELLHSCDLRQSLPRVIAELGQATGVDRAHFVEIDAGACSGSPEIVRHYLWSAADASSGIDYLRPGAMMTKAEREFWASPLEKGETIVGDTKDFAPAARRILQRAKVKSLMAVPVFVDGRWRGLIAFDERGFERSWEPPAIETVKTLAELIGAAVARMQHLTTLADAGRIVESSPTILYRLSPEAPFRLIYLSQNVRRYGYDPEALLASPDSWTQVIERQHHSDVMADFQSIVEQKVDSTLIELRARAADGSPRWLEGRAYAVRDEKDELVAIEGMLTDITERKSSEEALSFSNILLTTAIEGSPDAILIVDADDHILKFNRHFGELWGIPAEILNAGDDEPVLQAVAAQMKNQGEFLERVRYLYSHPEIQSEEEIEAADGRIIERHSGALRDAQHKYLGRVWSFRDITEKKRANARIALLARTDALTGLPNRTAFLDRLGLEFARAKRGGSRFALHYLDLDHFKDVNDTLGHPVGDALLRGIAERLKNCVREVDMVARFGGDEFAVLQNGTDDGASIEILAAKIGQAVSAPFILDGNQLQTTTSVGIVPYQGDIANVDAMMMKADLALYRAKNEGRNQFRLHVAELDEQTRERIRIGGELRHAIARDEFELYYQPQVELKSGRIVGLEALIRWNHPTRGLLLPSCFILIAETNGSIVPIGEWVIERACRQINHWNELGIAPPLVGVNLSGAQFRLAAQLDRIASANLARYGIAPERLELELTESVLIETAERHGEAFEKLRKIGVRLAIDDFGTGYSSLDYLRAFRVSRLKIDRRFIDNVMTNPDNAAIVRATVGLAHELGIEVVAEGVENARQRDFLIAAGCDFAQGLFFGMPMPEAAAGELLRRNLQSAAA